MNSHYGDSKVVDWRPEDLLLHRGPMLLLDRIKEVGAEHLIAEVDVTPDALYCQPTIGVPAWVGLEYMAQAAAALSGAWSRSKDAPVRLGLLIGCRRYTSEVSAFSPGSVLQVHVRLMVTLGDELAAFDCKILSDVLIASGRLTAYSGTMDSE